MAMRNVEVWDKLFFFGIALAVAGIVGGGVTAVGVEFPLLDSWIPQILLVLLGGTLIGFSLVLRPAAGSKEREKPAQKRKALPADLGDSLPRIAVLAFENLSGRDEDEALSDGLSEILIDKLTRVDGLRTIPKTSVMRFKESHFPIRQIGEELNVHYMLEGSLNKAEDPCLIRVGLVRVEDVSNVWSQTYTEPWTNVQDVGASVAKNVVTRILQTLQPKDAQVLSERPTEEPLALEAYMRGRHSLNQFNNLRREEYLRESESYFRRAVEIDAQYMDAWGQLGFLYILRWETDANSKWLKESEQIWERILEISPGDALALAELGYVSYVSEADSSRAVGLARRAVTEDPGHPIAHNVLALLYLYLGFYEANYRIEREEVFPRDPAYVYPYTNSALALQLMGRFEEALQQAQEARRIEPRALVTILLEGAQYFYQGKVDVAERTWSEGLSVCPDTVRPILEVALAWIAAHEGDRTSAKATVRAHMKDAWLRGPYGPYFISLCALAGEADLAIDMLEEESTYAASYRYLLSERTLRPLVRHPRYRDLLQRRYSAWQKDLEHLGPGLPEQPSPPLPGPEEFTRQAGDV